MGQHSPYFLTREQFRNAIRRGLGRALLHLKHHPREVYVDELLYACAHFTGYDAMVDGFPTAYLWTALNWSGYKVRLRGSIFDALLNVTDDRVWWQLLELTDQYARNGDKEAMDVLRQRFQSNPHADLLRGVEHIVRRTGDDGLRFAVIALGNRMLAGEIAANGHFILKDNPLLVSIGRLNSVLRPMAASNEAIQAFLNCIDADARDYQQNDTPRHSINAHATSQGKLRKVLEGVSFDEMLRQLKESELFPTIGVLRLWSRSASQTDILRAAKYFRDAQDEYSIDLGLSIFPFAAYPLDPQPLLELALGPDAKRSHFAFLSLHQLQHEKVRALYEGFIAFETPSRYVFGLLDQNYQAGDLHIVHQWLCNYAATYPDDPSSEQIEDLHRYGSDLYDVCRKQSASEGTGAIYRWLFDNMACKLCRCDALKRLVEQDEASEELLAESTLDADAGIRRIARRALYGR